MQSRQQRICEPVAANVAQAFESILDEQQKHIADIDPSLSDSVPDISSLLKEKKMQFKNFYLK